jgi:hypothetical protein
MRRQSSSTGTSRKCSSTPTPRPRATYRTWSRSVRAASPKSRTTLRPRHTISCASFHSSWFTFAWVVVAQGVGPRAHSQSSFVSRTAPRSAASCFASVVLPAPGNPQVSISRAALTCLVHHAPLASDPPEAERAEVPFRSTRGGDLEPSGVLALRRKSSPRRDSHRNVGGSGRGACAGRRRNDAVALAIWWDSIGGRLVA